LTAPEAGTLGGVTVEAAAAWLEVAELAPDAEDPEAEPLAEAEWLAELPEVVVADAVEVVDTLEVDVEADAEVDAEVEEAEEDELTVDSIVKRAEKLISPLTS